MRQPQQYDIASGLQQNAFNRAEGQRHTLCAADKMPPIDPVLLDQQVGLHPTNLSRSFVF